jgi:tRNA dimethylallyltransferase
MMAKDGAGDLKTVSPIFIAGPTAVGKSELALALAERIGGEIISVDSMQVYRGLDIGTAKPSAADRARVPHHLIDICDLRETFDAAQFVRQAQRAVAEIRSRHRRPIFCGGTGLYFKAFLEGLGEAPATRASLRAELEATPLDQLLAELQRCDPATHEVIDRQNPRRIVRAIEVIRLTGKPFSAQRANWGAPASVVATPDFFLLQRPGPELHARINARVDDMFQRGLVTETQQLLRQGLTANRTAMQAIGYRQVVEHLRGERGLAETVELVKSRTRQFAKRQLTWFRRHARAQCLELKSGESLDAALTPLLAGLPA